MIPMHQIKRICLVHRRVDFRQRHNGLLAEAYKLGINPLEGDVAVFIGRRRKSIQLLFADTNGLWLGYKLFHNGNIPVDFKFLTDLTITQITPSSAARLIEGSCFIPGGARKS